MKNDIRKQTLKEGEIIPLSFDFLFNAIFNKKENIIILENFLSCYLEIPLDKLRGRLTLCPRDLELENKGTANKQVDLILDLEDEKINIELSNRITDGIINRNIIFACNIHSRNLKYGDNTYNKIGKTIQINLNNYHTNEELKETYYLRNEKGKILSKKFRIDFLDMVIGKEICYTNSSNKLARWCKVFTARTEEEFKKAIGDGLMEENAKEQLNSEVNKYSRDSEVIALYSAYTKEELERNTFIEEALEQGLKEGREQGIEQNKIEIMKNMLKKNYSIDTIIDITGLSKEQIECYKKDLM